MMTAVNLLETLLENHYLAEKSILENRIKLFTKASTGDTGFKNYYISRIEINTSKLTELESAYSDAKALLAAAQ